MNLYKTASAEKVILELYDKKLRECGFEYEDIMVETSFGKTHVVKTKERDLEPIVVLHGINAGAPTAMEPLKHLAERHQLIGIDTIGQANKSAANRLSMKGSGYGDWLNETLTQLGIEKVTIIAASYGSFLLQRLIASHPERIKKAIFVVPSGFVSGSIKASLTQLSFPLIRFLMSKKEKHLTKFLSAFHNEITEDDKLMHRNLLLGFKMDYSRPLLMTSKEAEGFNQSVYSLMADDDIFFPGDKTEMRMRALFKNFKGAKTMKDCKHIPPKSYHAEIAECIENWLNE